MTHTGYQVTNPPFLPSIVVSAPRYTVPGSPVSYTGAVFSCPVSQGSCEGLVGDGVGADEGLYDSRGMYVIYCSYALMEQSFSAHFEHQSKIIQTIHMQ